MKYLYTENYNILLRLKATLMNEKTSVFMDWKAYYCYGVKTAQSDLQTQRNPYQNLIVFQK